MIKLNLKVLALLILFFVSVPIGSAEESTENAVHEENVIPEDSLQSLPDTPLVESEFDSNTSSSASSFNSEENAAELSESICLYPIKKGDTLTEIATALFDDYASWKKLVEWNHIENPDLIHFDKSLILKELPKQNFSCDSTEQAQTLRAGRKGERVSYRVYFERGVKVFERGEYERALRVFSRVRKDIPNYLPGWFYELNALKKLGREDRYADLKSELIKLRPELEKLPMLQE